MSFMLLGILNSQAAGGGGLTPAYELIESQVLSSDAASFSFTSIPADYKQLQIRASVRFSVGGSSINIMCSRLNGDSTSNYYYHYLQGNNSQGMFGAHGNAVTNKGFHGTGTGSGQSAGIYSTFIIDILDYASTSKKTSMKSFWHWPGNTGQRLGMYHNVHNSTAAMTSIEFFGEDTGSISANSRFSLYGIKG